MHGGERTTWLVRGAVWGMDRHVGQLLATVAGAPWVPSAATRFHRHQAAAARPHAGARTSTRVAVHTSAMALLATLWGGNTQEDRSTNLGPPHVGGGWHAPAVLRVCTEAPQGWMKSGPLPVPGISEAGEPSWRLILGTVYWLWGPWRRRELTRSSSVPAPLARESAAGPAQAKPAATAGGRLSPMAGDAGAKYRASRAVFRSCRKYNPGDETWCAVRYSTSSAVCSKYAGAEDLYEPSWRSCARWLTQDS